MQRGFCRFWGSRCLFGARCLAPYLSTLIPQRSITPSLCCVFRDRRHCSRQKFPRPSPCPHNASTWHATLPADPRNGAGGEREAAERARLPDGDPACVGLREREHAQGLAPAGDSSGKARFWQASPGWGRTPGSKANAGGVRHIMRYPKARLRHLHLPPETRSAGRGRALRPATILTARCPDRLIDDVLPACRFAAATVRTLPS